MPLLRAEHAGQVQAAQGGERSDFQASSLPVLQEGDTLGADSADHGSDDRGGFGVDDPAWSYFRSDAERRGRTDPRFAGPRGFAHYLKVNGIMSEKRLKIARDHEVTGTAMEREAG